MSLSNAIKNRDSKELKETVEGAINLYNQKLPDEAMVNTIHGDMPISMIFDEDTKWNVITSEYVAICNKVKSLNPDCDQKIETAKLISSSAILRHAVEDSKASSDDLL